MRHPNEHSGSSSLYAHPVALEPVPLAEGTPAGARGGAETKVSAATSRDLLESRLEEARAALEAKIAKPDGQTVADHLRMFARWYYRPAARRSGEVVFWDAEAAFPSKAILRAVSRVFRGVVEGVLETKTESNVS